MEHSPYGLYERFFKRPLDCVLAICALIVLSPVLLVTGILVRIKLGGPVLFSQERPGIIDPQTGEERIFKLYKFRSMTGARDEKGELLPDEQRLTAFGRKLRATSLDELPELLNIIKGDMALVGPRPQLVRDMVFMSPEQRKRHTVRPGLTGLAQVMGRNSISWDEKLDWDLKYIRHISIKEDSRIVWMTVQKLFVWASSDDDDTALSLDYGDDLLQSGRVSREEYEAKMQEAQRLLESSR